MRSAFSDFAIFHNDNLVGVHHAGEPVGNHQHGLAGGKLVQGFLNQAFIFGVCKGGCLVEHHDGSVLQDSARKHHSLLLATRKISSLAPDNGINTAGQLVDDFAALRKIERLVYLLESRVGHAVANVVQNAHLEKSRILKHERNVLHQFLRVNLLYGNTANGNLAAIDIEESWQEFCNRTLAAARRSDKCYRMARRYRERNVAQYLLVGIGVGEVHVPEFYIELLHRYGIFANLQILGACNIVDAVNGKPRLVRSVA